MRSVSLHLFIYLVRCSLYDLHEFNEILILQADLYLNKRVRLKFPRIHIVFCIIFGRRKQTFKTLLWNAGMMHLCLIFCYWHVILLWHFKYFYFRETQTVKCISRGGMSQYTVFWWAYTTAALTVNHSLDINLSVFFDILVILMWSLDVFLQLMKMQMFIKTMNLTLAEPESSI